MDITDFNFLDVLLCIVFGQCPIGHPKYSNHRQKGQAARHSEKMVTIKEPTTHSILAL